jgi:hypothetical protein
MIDQIRVHLRDAEYRKLQVLETDMPLLAQGFEDQQTGLQPQHTKKAYLIGFVAAEQTRLTSSLNVLGGA